MKKIKSGFLTLIGLPNAGKSSLFNQLLGEELAIVSPRAQTTWVSLRGNVVRQNLELVCIDTPGLQEGTKALNQAISRNAVYNLKNANQGRECVALVIDPVEIILSIKNNHPSQLLRIPNILNDNGLKLPLDIECFPLILKSDLIRNNLEKEKVEKFIENSTFKLAKNVHKPCWISTVKNTGIEEFLEKLCKVLPDENPGSNLNSDELTDKNMREVASELIREGCYFLLNDELPYSIAVEIEKYDEKNPKKIKIEACLHVEKESQKPILIGKGGEKIKKLRIRARQKIEHILGTKVELGLRVKVSPLWSKKKAFVNRLGYEE